MLVFHFSLERLQTRLSFFKFSPDRRRLAATLSRQVTHISIWTPDHVVAFGFAQGESHYLRVALHHVGSRAEHICPWMGYNNGHIICVDGDPDSLASGPHELAAGERSADLVLYGVEQEISQKGRKTAKNSGSPS